MKRLQNEWGERDRLPVTGCAREKKKKRGGTRKVVPLSHYMVDGILLFQNKWREGSFCARERNEWREAGVSHRREYLFNFIVRERACVCPFPPDLDMRRSSRGSSIPGWGDDDDSSDLGTSLLQAEVGPGVPGPRGPLGAAISRLGAAEATACGARREDDETALVAGAATVHGAVPAPLRIFCRGLLPAAQRADKDRINNDALARQQANNAKFMQQLKSEEDAFLARTAKKATEDADAAFARQLQQEEEAAAAAAMGRSGAAGGLPPRPSQGNRGAGRSQLVRINLPAQVQPGSVLRISVPGVGLRDVIVPPGAAGGSTVEYNVPVKEKIVVRVTLPDNCTPGQVISVRVPGTNETVQVTVPNNATPGSTLQFEVSPSRVPEPVQAVGFENSLGAAAEIYGGGMGVGAAPAQPTRRRRASSGVSPPLSLTVSVFGFFFSPKSRLPAFLLSLVYHYSLSSDSMHTLCKCTW